MPHRGVILVLSACAFAAAPRASAGDQAKAEGYAEFRKGPALVVDGQRVRLAEGGRFKGEGAASSFASIPLGYEVKAHGRRGADGTLLATEVEARPNGTAPLEPEVLEASERMELAYVGFQRAYNWTPDGRLYLIGRLYDRGPDHDRVRRLLDRLLPSYVAAKDVRVYIVDNSAWNAFAMANGSMYVFTGLLRDLDDDELALVVGHELAHATHEHGRRIARRRSTMARIAGIASEVADFASNEVEDPRATALVKDMIELGQRAFNSGFSRDMEDQADRVGLRYAYEGGFDHTRAPALWRRFATKYGQGGKVANFFYGDHSLASARASNLERELAIAYRDPAGDPRSRTAGPATAPSPAAAASADAADLARLRGLVEIGMTPLKVETALGRPQRRFACDRGLCWAYGTVTVVFEGGRVKAIR